MIAQVDPQAFSKPCPKLAETFAHALKSRIIANPNKHRIAGIVPVRDDVIKVANLLEEPIKEIILLQRQMHPKESAIQMHTEAQ